MGCSNSRGDLIERIDQDLLTDFEDQLGFENTSAETIVKVFRNYSKGGLMTKNHLNDACAVSKVNLNLKMSFLDSFSNESDFLVKKIICLGILLAKGEATEKINLLFETYSNRKFNFLSHFELEEMITDIIEISCIKIPKYVLSLNKQDASLRRYVSKISITVPSMITYHTDIFTETLDRITLEYFEAKMKNSKLLHLLNTKSARIIATQMYTNMVKPAENAMEKAKNMKQINKKTISYAQLPSIKTKIAKSKSII
ncbi:hypothetical protein SteCoe_32625 [Stentor coeruleus]|uniref:Uncharacterized protein n=1 Tax=Stentor coeruleus TaxID=5963 RepID=A0A1R2AYP2_9CILI|nr:hypothetical protein SteCoe_32625 [Stentor coeruleus]